MFDCQEKTFLALSQQVLQLQGRSNDNATAQRIYEKKEQNTVFRLTWMQLCLMSSTKKIVEKGGTNRFEEIKKMSWKLEAEINSSKKYTAKW